MERWEVVADGRFWLGEKALEVCSEVMLKDRIARNFKGRQKQRTAHFTEACIHPAQKQDQKTEWELLARLVIWTAVGDRE